MAKSRCKHGRDRDGNKGARNQSRQQQTLASTGGQQTDDVDTNHKPTRGRGRRDFPS